MKTTADKNLDEAKKHIRGALQALSQIVIDRCWGHDEYTPAYSMAIQDAYKELLRVRDYLDG